MATEEEIAIAYAYIEEWKVYYQLTDDEIQDIITLVYKWYDASKAGVHTFTNLLMKQAVSNRKVDTYKSRAIVIELDAIERFELAIDADFLQPNKEIENSKLVEKLLSNLSERQRTLMIQAYIKGMPRKEMAQIHNTTETNINSNLVYIIKKIRKNM